MKRTLTNNDNKINSKKTKFDDDIDALWGDELDDSVIEDCIKLASQTLREDPHKADESVLPPYDDFKPPRPFSSTQMDSSIRPTTSNTSNFQLDQTKNSSDIDIQRLRIQCEEKDGEVAILRSQLREVKTQSNIEFVKSNSEWKAKFTLSEKQVQTIKSELEFKNLEIANLKQKVLSLTKHGISVTLPNNVTKSPKPSTSREQPISPQTNPTKKLYATVNVVYPLKNVFMDSFVTNSKTEKFIIDNKLTHSFKNAIPYLQNKTVPSRVLLNKNKADIESIYPIMFKLCEETSDELGSTKNVVNINKIVCISLQCLEDLQDLLQEIKENLRTEDLLEADSIYLKNIDIASSSKNELGRNCAILLNFLSVLLPYSAYLKNYFIHNKHLDIREQVEYLKNIPYISTKRIHYGQDFLNKLATILNITGAIRKSNVMSLFLKSAIKLFNNICKINGYSNLSEIICTFTKELIFSRPLDGVTFELTYLLKEASRYTTFVKFLLNKSKNCTTLKKGILYFNEDACRFYVFVLIFDRSLSKNKTVPLEICLNMLFFIYNTYKFSYMLHHVDIKECECVPQLYKLVIELIFRTLECTEEISQSDKLGYQADFFSNGIALKVLNLMAFHCYELTEKYITVYSQFKEIERRLKENGVCNLDRLNINEDIPEIDSKSFENIGF